TRRRAARRTRPRGTRSSHPPVLRLPAALSVVPGLTPKASRRVARLTILPCSPGAVTPPLCRVGEAPQRVFQLRRGNWGAGNLLAVHRDDRDFEHVAVLQVVIGVDVDERDRHRDGPGDAAKRLFGLIAEMATGPPIEHHAQPPSRRRHQTVAGLALSLPGWALSSSSSPPQTRFAYSGVIGPGCRYRM